MSVSVCLSFSLSLSLSLSVSVSVRDRIFRSSSGSEVMLCTSGFMDDVIFAHKPTLLDVAAQLQRSAHAALGLAINCAQ